MNILWIPHTPWAAGYHTRDQYFIRHLREHHRVYTLTWETRAVGGAFHPRAYIEGTRFYRTKIDGLDAFHVRRIPDFLRPLRRDKAQSVALNQRFFREDVRRIVRDHDIDVVVTGPSSHLTGFPPFDLDVPLVFDYLDCHDREAEPGWYALEMTYVERSDAVLCISPLAAERAERFGKPQLLLPNGADVRRMAGASGAEVRRKHGLEGRKVVSLIGLTCSPRLYFLDAIRHVRQQRPEVLCLLVGRSPEIEAALARIPDAEASFLYVGPVPYNEVAAYFAATDVGMYPVDETLYYDAASPIKMLEYTAAGKPVVVPRIAGAKALGFPNFVFAAPTAEAYAAGLLQALDLEAPYVDEVERYDWKNLAADLEVFLEEAVAGTVLNRAGVAG
jgi:glycosyltransferase involved in cell wall biosynthesis